MKLRRPDTVKSNVFNTVIERETAR
ncbi:hypothetical protein CCACVL1_13666 [Corchorus capsularis]|uniref:Uncharacterized protein n=1 Tax=Corchorus capsularis TaxID=210143 RepID=A0A1R3IA30_COCAP|nr:hypothetical protein CCACVL1_13666 [Corchorus capsularis]